MAFFLASSAERTVSSRGRRRRRNLLLFRASVTVVLRCTTTTAADAAPPTMTPTRTGTIHSTIVFFFREREPSFLLLLSKCVYTEEDSFCSPLALVSLIGTLFFGFSSLPSRMCRNRSVNIIIGEMEGMGTNFFLFLLKHRIFFWKFKIRIRRREFPFYL